MELCRACMSAELELLQFDAISLENYNTLTNLAIRLDDGLPQCLCRVCWTAVEFFISFRAKCSLSNSVFHKKINEEKVLKPEENFINIELEKAVLLVHESVIDKVKVDNIEEVYLNDDEVYHNEEIEVVDIKTQVFEVPICETHEEISRGESNEKQIENKLEESKSQEPSQTIKPRPDILDCGLCHKQYPDLRSLYDHLEKHKKGTECSTCHETFGSWPRLLAHRINHIDSLQQKCHICGKKCTVDFHLEYHYRMNHYDKEFTGLECSSCNYIGMNPQRLSSHIYDTHKTTQTVCQICSEKFISKPRLRYHMAKQHSTKVFTCDQCDFTCKLSNRLAAHKLRQHSLERYLCSKCQRLFRNEEKLDAHKCHEAPICPVCGKIFRSIRNLRRHLPSHSNEHPYRCDRCPESFRRKYNLIAHLNKHEDNKMFKCEHCAEEFHSGRELLRHEKIHTENRRFKCDICKNGFKKNSHLKTHIKRHSKDTVIKTENKVDE